MKEKFLALYKTMEQMLQKVMGLTVREYEPTCRDPQKLYVCRVLRNYLQHNADEGFIAISEDMVSFLEEQIAELGSLSKKVEDIMNPKVYSKKFDDAVLPAIRTMNTKDYSYVPVMKNKKLYGFLTKDAAIRILLNDPQGKSFSDVKRYLENPDCLIDRKADAETALEYLKKKDVLFCMEKGKVCGVLTIKEFAEVVC